MRIVTWNLKHDSGSAMWPRLQTAMGADIVLLQESRRPPNSPAQLVWESVPHHDRGSAVLVSQGAIRSIPIAGYEGWVVGGEWLDGGHHAHERRLLVFSIHAPTSNPSRPRRPYVEEVVSILAVIRAQLPPQSDLIVGGGFNFLSLGHRKVDEQLETAARIFCSHEVEIRLVKKQVVLNRMFEWYAGDFGGTKGVIRNIVPWLPEGPKAMLLNLLAIDPAGIKLQFSEFDWTMRERFSGHSSSQS